MPLNYIFPQSPDPLLKTGIDTSSARIGHLNNIVDQVNNSDSVFLYCSSPIPETNLYFLGQVYIPIKKTDLNGHHEILVGKFWDFSVYNTPGTTAWLKNNDLFIIENESNIAQINITNNDLNVTGLKVNLNIDTDKTGFPFKNIYFYGIREVNANNIKDVRSSFQVYGHSGESTILNAENLETVSGFRASYISSYNVPGLRIINDGFNLENSQVSSLTYNSIKYFNEFRLANVTLTTLSLTGIINFTRFYLEDCSQLQRLYFSQSGQLLGKNSGGGSLTIRFINLPQILAADIDNLFIYLDQASSNPGGTGFDQGYIEVSNCGAYTPSTQARAALDSLLANGVAINVQGY